MLDGETPRCCAAWRTVSSGSGGSAPHRPGTSGQAPFAGQAGVGEFDAETSFEYGQMGSCGFTSVGYYGEMVNWLSWAR